MSHIDCKTIHDKSHEEEDDSGRGGIQVETLLRPGYPVEHLNGHDGKWIKKPLEG